MCNSLVMRWNRSFDCMERNMKHIEGLWPQSKCACFQGEQVLWDIRTLVILQMQQQSRCSFCVLVSFFLILLHSDVSLGLISSNYLLITILQRREEYWQWWGRIKQHDDVHEKEKIFFMISQFLCFEYARKLHPSLLQIVHVCILALKEAQSSWHETSCCVEY